MTMLERRQLLKYLAEDAVRKITIGDLSDAEGILKQAAELCRQVRKEEG